MEIGKPCIGFSMEDAQEAFHHMQFEVVIDYGDTCNKHPLYTWDDGHRVLVRCKNCGGFALVQLSEFHAFSDGDDSYYCDMFPVSGTEEAEQLNRDFDGYQIEENFKGNILCMTIATPRIGCEIRMIIDADFISCPAVKRGLL